MITRKQFLRDAMGVAAAAFGLTVLATCGTDSAPDPAPGSGSETGSGSGSGSGTGTGSGSGSGSGSAACSTSSTIGDNHGHVLVVTSADVAAGADKTYHIQGTSDHDHTVVLTAADFGALQAHNAIMTTSSFDADHDHSIMVACV